MSFTQFGSGFNIGTDQSIVITNQQDFSNVILDGKRGMMEMTAKDTLLESDVMDNGGIVDSRVISEGYTGTIEVEKQSQNFSQLVKFLDANYYNGGFQQFFTIVETIRLPNNQGTEVNTYIDCVFHGYKPGSWAKKSITKPRVEIKAAQRV